MIDDEKIKVKLTADQWFLCRSMGTDLVFLPFATDHEHHAYERCVVNVILMYEEKAAIQWCNNVDGVNISPKLPVHLQSYCKC